MRHAQIDLDLSNDTRAVCVVVFSCTGVRSPCVCMCENLLATENLCPYNRKRDRSRVMSISVKLGPRTVTVALPQTLGELRAEIIAALELPEGSLRLLCKGRAVEASNDAAPADAGIAVGAKLMAMFSAASALDAAAAAKAERMRGFDDDDRRQRTGGLGGRGTAAAAASRTASSNNYKFLRTRALPSSTAQFALGATPGVEAAAALLEKLASDACVLSLMRSRQWTVGLLAEMPPQGLVGVSTSCLMGFNRNRGQEIHLRLRTDDWRGCAAMALLSNHAAAIRNRRPPLSSAAPV